MADEEPTAAAAPAEEAKDDDAAPEEENSAHFEPVVQLEEVEVNTGEEDEEILYSVRAKLFLYGESLLDKGTGIKSWNDRGIGEAKILKHKENGKTRLLMRQEKTMKVIANHVVDPRIVLEPNTGSDRSWVWSAFDFSEGELVEKVFALRMKDSDVAAEFKKKFEEAQKINALEDAGADGAPDAAADEAAEALAGLTTGGNDAEEEAKTDEPKEE
ncbi:RanBP1 domain containing protein [Nitzschia inconspicua]|uniref:RanBP1 domain containing protein n=1 Tax=Nitzschia inconspicua TaxID=303405 RepID=A0A9K3M041_9STRA|nr:RanBP1 domain containing protein [Nitzschia inconspicua]